MSKANRSSQRLGWFAFGDSNDTSRVPGSHTGTRELLLDERSLPSRKERAAGARPDKAAIQRIEQRPNGPLQEMAMQFESHGPSARSAQVPVAPEDEIVDLVKESEVRTGKPGRRFVIHGADRLAYRVLAHPGGLEITRIDGRGRPFGCVFVPARSFEQHPIAHAQRAGCLFTQPLSS